MATALLEMPCMLQELLQLLPKEVNMGVEHSEKLLSVAFHMQESSLKSPALSSKYLQIFIQV